MVNYYRDLWQHRSEDLAPLTEMTSNNKTFRWDQKHQEAFDKIKQTVSKEVLLTYPDFSKAFDIHTDASDHQLGSIISQDHKPIAFCSRKLNSVQKRYCCPLWKH